MFVLHPNGCGGELPRGWRARDIGRRAHADQTALRAAAIRYDVPLISTLTAAQAAVNGIRALREKELSVRSLQEHHQP